MWKEEAAQFITAREWEDRRDQGQDKAFGVILSDSLLQRGPTFHSFHHLPTALFNYKSSNGSIAYWLIKSLPELPSSEHCTGYLDLSMRIFGELFFNLQTKLHVFLITAHTVPSAHRRYEMLGSA